MQFHGTADRYTLAGATRSRDAVFERHHGDDATRPSRCAASAQAARRRHSPTTSRARSSIRGRAIRRGRARSGTGIAADPLRRPVLRRRRQPDYVDLDEDRDPAGGRAAAAAREPDRAREHRPQAAAAVLVLPARREGRRRHDGRRSRATTARPAGSTFTRADSPAGCNVDDWECVRGDLVHLSRIRRSPNAQVAAYVAEGFEIGVHVTTGCSDYTPESLPRQLRRATLADVRQRISRAAPPVRTQPTHCIVWSDYDTQPQVELANGIRLDTNYYYWPGSWVQNRPGFLTGSGMPMRFAKARRHDDRRLSGGDADDRRIRSDASRSRSTRCSTGRLGPKATTASSSPTCTPTRRPRRLRRDRRLGAGARRAGDFGEAAARLARRPQRRHLYRARPGSAMR